MKIILSRHEEEILMDTYLELIDICKKVDINERMTIGALLGIEWFAGVDGGCAAVSNAGCVVGSTE